jgi:cell wall-associated NlpC family hydrolase
MTNKEFVQKLLNVLNYKTVYMWGCFGSPVTEELLMEKYNQYPNWYINRASQLRSLVGQNYFGFDCVGLIKGILWGWNGDLKKYHGGARYGANGVPDINADTMIAKCKDVSKDFKNILPGEAVWLSGHIGVYIGDGKVIESTPIWANGVQITDCWNVQKTNGNGRLWIKHGKLPWVVYG